MDRALHGKLHMEHHTSQCCELRHEPKCRPYVVCRAMRRILPVIVILLTACAGSDFTQQPADDTALVQAAVDRGGLVMFDARTYHLNRPIVVSKSGTIIAGKGPATKFVLDSFYPNVPCEGDAVFETSCDQYYVAGNYLLPQQIAKPIAAPRSTPLPVAPHHARADPRPPARCSAHGSCAWFGFPVASRKCGTPVQRKGRAFDDARRQRVLAGALLLILALSGCVFATPYGRTLISPITAVQELFSGNGSDAEPGPTHRDRH